MDKKLQELGDNFKRIRKQNGFTQEQMAKFLGMERSCLARFESGERKIGVSALEKACNLFGCTLAQMDGRKPYEPLATAFRAKELTIDDMKAVSQIQKLVLNLQQMKSIEKEEM